MILSNVERDIYKPYQYMSPTLIKHQKKTILLLTKGILNSNICQMIFFLGTSWNKSNIDFQTSANYQPTQNKWMFMWHVLRPFDLCFLFFIFFSFETFFWTIPVIWSSLPSLNTNNTQWGIEHQIDAFLRHINQTRM